MSANGTIDPEIAPRALIAEDERLIALALRSGLESQGYQVVGIAGTGLEVLDLATSCEPHIILMDVRMPEMDGILATRRLMLEDPACIVIVSGSREPEQIASAMQAGAMDYIVKPLETYQIRPILDRAQRRFSRFLAIRSQATDPQEALESWILVSQAVKTLLATENLTEQAAHDLIEQKAATHGLSLQSVAKSILQAIEEADETL